jgi:hypothetical protein
VVASAIPLDTGMRDLHCGVFYAVPTHWGFVIDFPDGRTEIDGSLTTRDIHDAESFACGKVRKRLQRESDFCVYCGDNMVATSAYARGYSLCGGIDCEIVSGRPTMGCVFADIASDHNVADWYPDSTKSVVLLGTLYDGQWP